jgi:hypothetical protein
VMSKYAGVSGNRTSDFDLVNGTSAFNVSFAGDAHDDPPVIVPKPTLGVASPKTLRERVGARGIFISPSCSSLPVPLPWLTLLISLIPLFINCARSLVIRCCHHQTSSTGTSLVFEPASPWRLLHWHSWIAAAVPCRWQCGVLHAAQIGTHLQLALLITLAILQYAQSVPIAEVSFFVLIIFATIAFCVSTATHRLANTYITYGALPPVVDLCPAILPKAPSLDVPEALVDCGAAGHRGVGVTGKSLEHLDGVQMSPPGSPVAHDDLCAPVPPPDLLDLEGGRHPPRSPPDEHQVPSTRTQASSEDDPVGSSGSTGSASDKVLPSIAEPERHACPLPHDMPFPLRFRRGRSISLRVLCSALLFFSVGLSSLGSALMAGWCTAEVTTLVIGMAGGVGVDVILLQPLAALLAWLFSWITEDSESS